MTEVLVLTNDDAGSADAGRLAAAVRRLRDGGSAEVVRVSDGPSTDEALDHLDGRVLVVAGGDGSVHHAVGRLLSRGMLDDVVCGVIPLGTGNDTARGLGLPLDPEAAADAIRSGRPRRLDLLVGAGGSVVVNAVHVGVGAEASAVASHLKGALGPLAYPLGAVVAAGRTSGWDLRVTVDGREVAAGRTLLVGVGNGPTIGGGTPLFAGARPDDGEADVVVSRATGPIDRIRFGWRLRSGNHLGDGDVVRHRGEEVVVTGDPAPGNADGELEPPEAERSYRVLPGVWSVLTP